MSPLVVVRVVCTSFTQRAMTSPAPGLAESSRLLTRAALDTYSSRSTMACEQY